MLGDPLAFVLLDASRKVDSTPNFVIAPATISGRRQDHNGIASVPFEFIRNVEILAGPDDPLGLRVSDMVDCQHR